MLFNLLLNAVIGFLFLCCALLLGHSLLRLSGAITNSREEQEQYHLNSFFALVLGMIIIVLALMLLGYLGFLNPLGVSFAAGGLLLIALHSGRTALRQLLAFSPLEAIAIALVFALTVVFSWHMPGHWDDTSFHLPLARFYLEQEAIILHEYVRFPLFPQNMNMLITLGLMLGDATTAQLFATLPWFVIAIGLMAMCKQFIGSSLLGILIAVVMIKEVGVIKLAFGYTYVDVGLAMFCWAALLAVVHYWQHRKNALSNQLQWLVAAGFFAGAAAGTKLFGGVFAFILMFCVLFISRSLKLSFIFGVAVLVTGIWWYLRSYLISGDPFHPAGGNIFGHFLWNKDDLLSQVESQNALGSGNNPLKIVAVLQKIHTEVFIFALGGCLLKGLAPVIRLMQIVFISYFCFWFFVAQIERYLAPVVVLGTFLAFYTLFFVAAFLLRKMDWLLPKDHNRSVTINVIKYVFIAALFIFFCRELSVANKRFDAHLKDFSGYELFTKASELTSSHGNRMVQIGFENAAYFFTGTAIGDWFGVARYSQMLSCDAVSCVLLDQNRLAAIVDYFDARILAVSILRYPTFNPNDYTAEFDVVFSSSQGVLLTRKKNAVGDVRH